MILRVVPMVMKTMRTEMRACPLRKVVSLSVPQFRTLNFTERHPGSSLSDLAEHLGVTMPSMSRMVEGLVDRKLLLRRDHDVDRRRMTLRLTQDGRALLSAAHDYTESMIAKRVVALSGEERGDIIRAMGILHPLFAMRASSKKGKASPQNQ